MKRSALSLAVALMFAVTLAQATTPKSNRQNDQNMKDRSFSGVIMDSACAQMGSHQQMEEKHGMKGSDKMTGEEARKCTEECVKNGSTYVLYNPSNKMTYQLSDQDKAKMYAGERVKVKGTYDESSKTITVNTITPSKTGTM